ncbi:MAG: hypothetical protein L3J84_12170 [Gammaproteobacteria bacterium]|nr:hypothetical protein [Gammaproteobacteria bacterium]
MNQVIAQEKPSAQGAVQMIYILYLISIFTGITGIIGVVMAYRNKDDAPDWLKSHYQFQIRTFWIGVLYILIGFMLTSMILGYFILLFWAIWVIVRCVKGMHLLDQKSAHTDPKTWMF